MHSVTHLIAYNQENGGLFGNVSAYYGITEEQLTGTLHNHMLVWLLNNIEHVQAKRTNSILRKLALFRQITIFLFHADIGIKYFRYSSI